MEQPKPVKPIHQEASAALMTRRPELLNALRAKFEAGITVEDGLMLLNALESSIIENHENVHRINEVEKILKDMYRVLKGAAGQASALRSVLTQGGSYKSHLERERELAEIEEG